MTSNPLQGHPDGALLRKQAGEYLKRLRTDARLTQREVAEALGLSYYTLIAQIEAGKTRLPPDKQAAMAKVLGIRRYALAQRLLQFYDPYTWDMIWGPETTREEGE